MKLSPTARILVQVFFLFALTACQSFAQVSYSKISLGELEAAFEKYREPAITHRRVKHADLQPLIQKHATAFQVEKLGESVDGRSVSSMDWGKGKTKVMLWSQMHGNESTATMALFDLFNFLEGKDDGFDDLRSLLQTQLNL